jgi:Ni,Fe-hydrogenase III large subunit/Ni,Fe-hydrogenase III component G
MGSSRATGTRDITLVEPQGLVAAAAALLDDGYRIALVAAEDDGDSVRVVYLFLAGSPDRRVELHVRCDPVEPAVPTLAGLSFPAGRFEREMHDLFGVVATGHPFFHPLVLHNHWPAGWHPMRSGAGEFTADAPPGAFPFVELEGHGAYEIPVGPVHAGLIEPGHFRFSVVGETILKMTARLWFLHRGMERLFEDRDAARGIELAERLSGDTAVGHGLAFVMAYEEATGVAVSDADARTRAVLLELERLYNHVADVGAMCNDVGFGVAQARALLLRETLLRLNEEVTGHRLLRGAIRPGVTAVRRLPTPAELAEVAHRFESLVDVALANSVVVDRFEGTAVLGAAEAAEIGTLGPVARASGGAVDARIDHPFTPAAPSMRIVIEQAGDVMARFTVRADEVRVSLAVIAELLDVPVAAAGPAGPAGEARGSGVGITEGWRGTIVHRVEVDARGLVTRCKVVDPSFFTWPALAVSLADTIVPDFPLVNKSFNLSYAGNDL